MAKLILYSDGACSGNPGPGGYGAVLEKGGKTIRTFSNGYRLTTNNRMELLGVIEPLEQMEKPSEVDIYTDAQYVSKAITEGWLTNWIKKGWKKSNKKPVLNIDLWERMRLMLIKHKLSFYWVRGHSNHPQNEMCDKIAVEIIHCDSPLIDEEYEKVVEEKKVQ